MEVIGRREALEKGLKRYFTGKPCKHGHLSQRKTAKGGCSECSKIWAEKNPEKVIESNRKYYLANTETISKRNDGWAKNNKERKKRHSNNWKKNNAEHCSLYCKEWASNNREKVRESDREWKRNNPEKANAAVKRWIAANQSRVKESKKRYYKEKKAEYVARARKRYAAKLKAAPSWLTKKDLDSIKLIYKDAAERSQRDGIQYHVDHIVPLQGESVSGLHVPWNLQILEASENMSKSNRFGDM